MSTRLHRRALALGAPFAVLATATAARTPESIPAAPADDPLGIAAQVEARDPEDLLATLLAAEVAPMTSENFTPFVPMEWTPDEGDEFPEGVVGGVLIVHAEATEPDQHSILGGYLVFASGSQAGTTVERLQHTLSSQGTFFPVQLAGLPGYTSVSGEYANTVLEAGNVMISAGDAFFTDGVRLYATDSVFRSTVHTVSLLDHLDSVTRPEADR